MKIVVFEVAGQRFGLKQEIVSELAHAVPIAPLPSAPAIVEGVINVRGIIAPVLNLRQRFGLPAKVVDHKEHLIVARAGARTVAVRADKVLDLAEIAEEQVTDSRGVSPGSDRRFGIAKLADGLVLIYDLGEFLSQAESEQLASALPSGEPAGS